MTSEIPFNCSESWGQQLFNQEKFFSILGPHEQIQQEKAQRAGLISTGSITVT